MKSLKVKQWTFFFGALLACGAFSLLASPADVPEPAKRSSAAEIAFAATSEAVIADLGSMVVASARAELGSMTVTASRVRWV